MAWSGGNFTRANPTWVSDAAAGIGIEAARHDTQDNDFTTGINECLNKTGQNGMSGTLSMGSNKISNLAAGTLRNDAAQVGQVQDGTLHWGSTSGGSANAQTLTLSPVITAYAAGQRFSFLAGFTNTAAATLNVNAVGAKDIFNAATGAAINAGEVISGRAYEVIYDGTRFLLLNDVTPIQNGDYIWLGTTGGTATAQTATATPAITAYKAGQKFRALIGTGLSSTGQTPIAHTININGLGAKNIENQDEASSPTNGTFIAGNVIELLYTGSVFKITNDPGGWKTWTPNLVAPVGTASAITVFFAGFRKIGHTVTITGYVGFSGTGVGVQFEITNPPVALATTATAYVIQPLFITWAATNGYGYMYNNSGTNIAFTRDAAGTNFGTSAGSVRFTYTYQGQ